MGILGRTTGRERAVLTSIRKGKSATVFPTACGVSHILIATILEVSAHSPLVGANAETFCRAIRFLPHNFIRPQLHSCGQRTRQLNLVLLT